MENRFGIKDFFLYLLIVALIVMVVLAMRQFDRQYREILTIKQQNSELTRDVVGIKRQLAEGVVALGSTVGGGPTTGPTTAAAQQTDPFHLLKEAEQEPHFARGDWLIDNFGTKVGKLTPLISSDVYATWVEFLVFEGLAQRDPYTLEFVPKLARGWEISDDGLRMRFFLRRGITFSDGEPMDADDVIFTFNWVRNPQVNAPRERAYLTKLKDVKKIDSHTVEFTFNETFFLNFSTVAGFSIMPEHFYARFTPDQFNEKTGLVMGTGPYKLENPETWTPGTTVQLIRNDRYWGVAPTFDRVVFHEIQGESTQMVLYGNKEHDIIRCTPEQYRTLLNDARVMAFSNNHEYRTPFGGYTYIGWNQLRKEGGRDVPTFFADKRVRRAMTMLLDRERMTREIYYGYATVASGPFAPGGPQADPEIQPWPHDASAARALLAEAGFTDRDGDGVLDSPDGKPFKFKLTYPSGNETTEKIVLFMKDNFARGGIIMEPERTDWPVLVNKLNLSDFEAVTLGWSSVPESDPYQVFHSDNIKDQGDNRIAYSSPELDAVIEKGRVTMDREKRMGYWHQVHRILHEDQPFTFLFNRKALRLFNERVHNVKESKLGLNYEHLNGGVLPWFIPKDQHKYTR